MDNSKWTMIYSNDYFSQEHIFQFDTLEECIEELDDDLGCVFDSNSDDMPVMIFPPRTGISSFQALDISDLELNDYDIEVYISEYKKSRRNYE